MKALIINYNRLTLPKNMADYLNNCGITPIFIDNNSTYQPLLEYYNTCGYQVIKMPFNFGHTVIWDTQILNTLIAEDEEYIISDSDLDLSEIPTDFLQILHDGLVKYPQYDKCGFSLRINDLPNSNMKNYVIDSESVYWNSPLDKMYFDASVDTTFALYRMGVRHKTFISMRTNEPYCAKHVPWYYLDYNTLPEDEKYYFNTIQTSTYYSQKIK